MVSAPGEKMHVIELEKTIQKALVILYDALSIWLEARYV